MRLPWYSGWSWRVTLAHTNGPLSATHSAAGLCFMLLICNPSGGSDLSLLGAGCCSAMTGRSGAQRRWGPGAAPGARGPVHAGGCLMSHLLGVGRHAGWGPIQPRCGGAWHGWHLGLAPEAILSPVRLWPLSLCFQEQWKNWGKSPPFPSEMMGSSPSHCSELDRGHINHIASDRDNLEALLVANLGTAEVKGISLTPLARCRLSLYCEKPNANLFLMAGKLILNFDFKGLWKRL